MTSNHETITDSTQPFQSDPCMQELSTCAYDIELSKTGVANQFKTSDEDEISILLTGMAHAPLNGGAKYRQGLCSTRRRPLASARLSVAQPQDCCQTLAAAAAIDAVHQV